MDSVSQRLALPTYVSQGQSHVAVILVDESSLAGWQEDWPLTFDRFRGIINVLACDHVRAIFFDTFPSRFRETPKAEIVQLSATINDSSSGAAPCESGYLPDRVDVAFGKAAVIQGEPEELAFPFLSEMESAGRRFWIQYSGDGTTYPVGQDTFPNGLVSMHDLTPAFGLLRRLCDAGSPGSAVKPDFCRNVPFPWATQPLEVRWNNRIDPYQHLISAHVQEDCPPPGGLTHRLGFAIGASNEGSRTRCPPILTMRASQLYDGSVGRAETAGRLPLGSFLRGRIVLVGAMLTGVSDWTNTPIQGSLPGVYAHAMAIDNLMTYGPDYPTQPRQFPLVLFLTPLFFFLELAREFFFLPRRMALERPVTATTVTDDGSFPLAAVRDTSIIIAALTLIALYLLFGNLCFNWSLNFMLFVMAKIVITYLGAILASLPIIYWISKRGLVKQPDSTKRDFHAS